MKFTPPPRKKKTVPLKTVSGIPVESIVLLGPAPIAPAKVYREAFWNSPLGGACAVFVEKCSAIDADPTLMATIQREADAGGLTAETMANPKIMAREVALDGIGQVISDLRFHVGRKP